MNEKYVQYQMIFFWKMSCGFQRNTLALKKHEIHPAASNKTRAMLYIVLRACFLQHRLVKK